MWARCSCSYFIKYSRDVIKYEGRVCREIRLFFQHAEEAYPGGGQEMVEAGVMDGVDYVIGLHVMSGLERKDRYCVWANDGSSRRIYS